MRFSVLVLALAFIVTPGCKKKEAATTASPNADVLGDVNIPKDDNSKMFATRILQRPITDFSPVDSMGAKLIYKTLTFKNNNAWIAESVLGVGDESVNCTESGLWSMDAATDDHTANMTWDVNKTTCPGRSESNTIRVNVNIEKGEYTISRR